MVRVLLQSLDPTAITLSIAYDYNPAPVDVRTFTAAQIAAFVTPMCEFEVQPTRPRQMSMQITLSDGADAGRVTGQGFKFVGVRVDYGYEPSGFRTPVAQRG